VQAYDAIVVGLGAIGSGATYHLARRGARVLGLDMFDAGHDQGSSHGHHRMIRRWSHRPGFQPLAERAFELWRELEAESGRNIMSLIGEVRLTDHAATRIPRNYSDDLTRGGKVEILQQRDLDERFPGFRLHGDMTATYEADAGFLRPEVGMAAHLEVATRHGATIQRNEEVTGWDTDGDGVQVTTNKSTYRADRLVIAAGPWAAELLLTLGLPLQVVRIVNVYFEPERSDWWRAENGAPDFTLGVPEGGFYGMPSIEGVGLKIGRHDNGEPTTARTIRRNIDDAEVDYLRNVLDRYMPGASGQVTLKVTCMYTMTPDENYIVERHPELPQVVYGCGFSGTGYKFSGVMGEALAELALHGRTTQDISFLASARFGEVSAG
jgi:sarcosine oxidase